MSNIRLSRLIPYEEEVIVDHQCGIRCNRSTNDHIFCNYQILEKKWKYNETVNQLFIEYKKAYETVRKEVFYNTRILIELGVHKELVRLVKMCLTEMYNRKLVGKNVSSCFLIGMF